MLQIRDALEENPSLVSLGLTQFGQMVNEGTRDEIRLFLERNKKAVPPELLPVMAEVEVPRHIAEIYSVYRTHL